MHAPNHRHIKGTDALLDAIRRLSAAGLELELQVVEQVPRREAQALYAAADIVADQFCIGAYGVFALEGLALGKPVVAYLDEEHLGDPVFDLPIVNAHAGNLEQVLAALVAVPALRQRLGQAGRQAVEKLQSIEALAEVWAQIYAHLWWGVPLALDTTRHFSTDRRARFFSEDPSRAEFWPVPVEDLLPDIVAAIEERACAA